MFIDVFGAELQLVASATSACQSPKFPTANRSIVRPRRPAVANWIFRGFVAAHFGTYGLSQSPVRRFGTHCLIYCVIQPLSLNALSGTWRRMITHLFAGH